MLKNRHTHKFSFKGKNCSDGGCKYAKLKSMYKHPALDQYDFKSMNDVVMQALAKQITFFEKRIAEYEVEINERQLDLLKTRAKR